MNETATHKYQREFITKFNISFLRKSNAGQRDRDTHARAHSLSLSLVGENLTICTGHRNSISNR
jgi:hypothetical protein